MSVLSSIDTSQFTTPFAATQTATSVQQVISDFDKAKAETPNVAAIDKETPKVDLNNYYSNVQASATDNTDVAKGPSGVAQASQNFSNAVALAVEHGMNPQDAVNIQKAKAAYESSIKMAQTSSTFQLDVQ